MKPAVWLLQHPPVELRLVGKNTHLTHLSEIFLIVLLQKKKKKLQTIHYKVHERRNSII